MARCENQAALKQRGMAHAAVCGSRAGGDQSDESDIDIMIEINPDAPVDALERAGESKGS
jgi:uncharacterized protein